MGERVEFPSNAHTCQGYLARPDGQGPAVVVIQEWWGLVPHVEDLVDRFARAGFLALAPDLYHGKTTSSPDEAGKMLMELDGERAEREIAGAGDFLLGHSDCSSDRVGIVGFCMGGALAQYSATKNPKVGAAVSFYGGFKKLPIAWENLRAPILLIYGENDKGVPAGEGRSLARRLEAMGKECEIAVYPEADHAFFNDSRPEVYNEAASQDAWRRTVDFFRRQLTV
ncbi:MAG TPA: dienelactone hydrolase family protein [Thermoanaerobaculia bacterium]|nr:dienelactone hydrolase family protein [Thermoanaerobaculia bacterium]